MFSTNQNRIIRCVLTLLLALVAFTAQGQRNTAVTGVIKDTQGPVPGVSIIVKGTLNGTTTDVDGNFSLNVDDKDILQISCIGYVSQRLSGTDSFPLRSPWSQTFRNWRMSLSWVSPPNGKSI